MAADFRAGYRLTSSNGRIFVSKVKLLVLFFITSALPPATVRADVRPHGLFTEDMVLQQGTTVPIWGTAAKDEKVTVRFQNQEVSAEAKDGKWHVDLKNLEPGGPLPITMEEDSIEFENVLVGEVRVDHRTVEHGIEALGGQDGKEDSQANSTNPMMQFFSRSERRLPIRRKRN